MEEGCAAPCGAELFRFPFAGRSSAPHPASRSLRPPPDHRTNGILPDGPDGTLAALTESNAF